MSQRHQLERIFEIDRQIRAGRYPNADKLAAEMEWSRSTIYEDRKFMIDRLRAPIDYDRERDGWYYTDPTWVLPTVMIDEGELVAFFLSVEVAQRYVGTALEGTLHSAVEKIAQSIKGVETTVDLERLRANYSVAQSTAAQTDERILLDFHQAIQERRQVEMNYYTAKRGEWNDRTINPHHLYHDQGAWYVFGFDHLRQQMRNFHLGRIKSWKVLTARFEREHSFSAQEWMAHAFQGIRGEDAVEVQVWFDEYQARWIREQEWPEHYEIEELDQGELTLTFETAGLEGVKMWVMKYGSHAEVLAPPELRAEVADELRGALRRYESGRE